MKEMRCKGFMGLEKTINMDLVKIRAFLPEKLSELSRVNEPLALKLLRDWGDGKKTLRDLWAAVHEGLEVRNENNQPRVAGYVG